MLFILHKRRFSCRFIRLSRYELVTLSEKMKCLFPVLALNNNITQLIKKIPSAGIYESITEGLNNEILFIDQDCPISDVAEIVKFIIDGKSYVSLSAAYCQYLWLMCSIIIREIDLSIVREECERRGITLEQFIELSKQVVGLSQEQVCQQIPSEYKEINIEQYIDYLKRISELLNNIEFCSQQEYYIKLLSELTKKEVFNLEDFSAININTPYGQKINSVYCFGICFILLHEASHFSLGHMDKESPVLQDEIDADSSSFWDIYSDIPESEKFSANCGVLCALFSLLYLNPTIEPDNIHPTEDDRILRVYECIKKDNPKYTVLLVQFFIYWAKIYQIDGFPTNLQNTEDSVDKIKDFLAEYKKIKA